jgi:hypothetical protein
MTTHSSDGRCVTQQQAACMCAEQKAGPDSTAVRVALWRALHVQVDPAPHVLEDEIGRRLVNPDDGWRKRGDMNPRRTRRARASIVGRARIVEDLVTGQAEQAASQYVILGAGLDTFAQRRPEVASRMRVFEIDRPGPQSRFRGCPARVGSRPDRALLRRPDRWPPAVQLRGTSGRGHAARCPAQPLTPRHWPRPGTGSPPAVPTVEPLAGH